MHQFQVGDRTVPTIKTNQFGLKSAFESSHQHFRKMIVLCLAVTIFIKQAIIDWHTPQAISPQQSNQVDAADHQRKNPLSFNSNRRRIFYLIKCEILFLKKSLMIADHKEICNCVVNQNVLVDKI